MSEEMVRWFRENPSVKGLELSPPHRDPWSAEDVPIISDLGLETLATPFTVEPLGIALPADDPLLVNLVENFLDTLEYTGLLMQFKAKWLSSDSWLSELP